MLESAERVWDRRRTVRRVLKLLLSLVVTAFFTWLAFRSTNWSEQWKDLRSANYAWVIPYLLSLGAIHLLRTWRWGALLSGLEKVRFRQLNEASGIGFMMLLVLPFRLGEFARPYLIAQRSGIRKSAAMTTVVLERIVDGLFVAAMLRTMLFLVSTDGKQVAFVEAGANLMFLVFGGGLTFLLFAAWKQELAVRLVRATAGRVAPRLADKAAEVVDAFVGALRQLPSPGQMVIFFATTLAYWALNGWATMVLARAFGIELSLLEAYTVLSVLVVGLMVPAAPGMMGTFQFATITGLALFIPEQMATSTGVAYANVMWLCQIAQQVIFGLILMSMSRISFGELAGKLDTEGAAKEEAAVVTPTL